MWESWQDGARGSQCQGICFEVKVWLAGWWGQTHHGGSRVLLCPFLCPECGANRDKNRKELELWKQKEPVPAMVWQQDQCSAHPLCWHYWCHTFNPGNSFGLLRTRKSLRGWSMTRGGNRAEEESGTPGVGEGAGGVQPEKGGSGEMF